MMDRNREAVRRAGGGSMSAAAVNGSGGGLTRRRQQQRSTNLRESPPEEDGAMETHHESSSATHRLRDRGGLKKDRDRGGGGGDRDASASRSSKRMRRGERLMHASSREREEDGEEDTSDDESTTGEDEDEEDEEQVSVTVRANSNSIAGTMLSSSSSIPHPQQNHHHHHPSSSRKSSFSAKPVRPPSWKVAEEMIGVSIPRKARSASLKRSQQECWVSGGGGAGGGTGVPLSTSPARPSPSPSSIAALSPPSSNVSVRKKKPISGSKHRPPKLAKSSAPSSSVQEDIEIEVAEVLFGMTRQAQMPPATNNKHDDQSKDTNALGTSEKKSRGSSPNSTSEGPSTSQPSILPYSNVPMVAVAPKRKRPRLKLDEESPTSPASSLAPLTEVPPAKAEDHSSPRSDKNITVENGARSCAPSSASLDSQQDLSKPLESINNQVPNDGKQQGKVKEEEATNLPPSKSMQSSSLEASLNPEEEVPVNATSKDAATTENPRQDKFSIDLMAPPPPEKSSSERDGAPEFVSDHKSLGHDAKMLPNSDIANGELEKGERASSKQEGTSENQSAGNFLPNEFNLQKHTSKDKVPHLQFDLEKHGKDGLSLSCGSKQQEQQQQASKQQHKYTKTDSKQDKPAPSASLPLTMPMAGWPGGFPPFGFVGQVPSLQAVVPMDASAGSAKTVQQSPNFSHPQFRPPFRPKRCATHFYIAQNIAYFQQVTRMSPLWSSPAAAAAAAAAVGAAPLYGAKQYNLNAVPASESAAILGNPLHGDFPPKGLGPLPPKSVPAVALTFTGPPPKENSTTAGASSSNFLEAAQKKQFMLQQSPQPGSSAAPPNMIGPAFIFPINQQHAVGNQTGASSKSRPGNVAQSASLAAAGSGSVGDSAAMSFNYATLPPSDAQYMAILRNNAILPHNGYPFPIAAAHVGAPPQYRGASPAQSLPFFTGPFYSSQGLPTQQQQQLMQQQQQQLRQQQQQWPPARTQQGHQAPSTSSGSSSSQKHTEQSQRIPGSGTPAAPPAGSNLQSFPASKQQLALLPPQARHLENDAGCEDSPSTADSRKASHTQKGLYSQNVAMPPMHSRNFALISPATAALAGSGGSHSDSKQSVSHQHQQQPMKVELNSSQAQAYAMSLAPLSGTAAAAAAGAPGFDLSAFIMQNPTVLNLQDIAKHGYHIPAAAMAAAAASAVQTVQHKKSHHEDGKAKGDPAAANAGAVAEEVKHSAASGGGKSGQQHSLTFGRPDGDPTTSNFTNGGRALNPPGAAATSTTVAATNSSGSPHLQQQQQQQMIQFQKQQQRMLQLQQQQNQQQQLQLQQMTPSRAAKSPSAQTGSANPRTDRLAGAGSSMPARFPQSSGLGPFAPSLVQGTGQPQQWKNSAGRAATPAPTSSATSSSASAKNQIPQQHQQHQLQGKSQQQQSLLNSSAHQTQISFGVTSTNNKPLGAGSSNPSLSAAAVASGAIGSPQGSVSKSSAATAGSNGGSPRASTGSKPGHLTPSVLPTFSLQQQQSAAASKSSPSAPSNLKSSSPIATNSRHMASILGHPQSSNPSSGGKLQQHQQQSQQQQLQLQKQSFQQPQLFFNNPYPSSTAAAAAAGFYQQRRPADQQQQQHSTSSGMLTLAGTTTAATPDLSKAAMTGTSGGIKGLPNSSQAGILQHTTQYPATLMAAPHPCMSGAFPYVHTMAASVSLKPAASTDQKQSTAGSDNMHVGWKPEKR